VWAGAAAEIRLRAAQLAPISAVRAAAFRFHLRAALPATLGASALGVAWGLGTSLALIWLLRFQPSAADAAAAWRTCLALSAAALAAGAGAAWAAARKAIRAAHQWTPLNANPEKSS
jgi:hypothetical protein